MGTAYSLYEHYRNIKDDQIKACAQTGGVIGLNGMGEFTDDDQASSEALFKHADYVAQLVGVQHVSIGLDFVKNTGEFWRWVRSDDVAWPWNKGRPHREARFAEPEQIIEIAELLLRHGYADQDVRAVLGENLVRVALQVWQRRN